ncbi:hypothetical protein DXV75_15420 [Alteromonas aestuariivivens]|uniref:Uncharacterized protein n=1 Tax=Alteromonas aestuariivivens TaxID=1938339 RepID=A0A3D8M3V2_9ALTE|nr:hypothetical protein DXV75_15420 [Alteromonas aestuariivivens]
MVLGITSTHLIAFVGALYPISAESAPSEAQNPLICHHFATIARLGFAPDRVINWSEYDIKKR